ncbi:MAG: STAS domain-containing protein [Gemmatimonadota bacterium]|nr:MAG: STAS domain-containing protein [Gemmatimonadota bacterium]
MKFEEETFGDVQILHLQGKIMGGPETQVLRHRLEELVAFDTRFLVIDFQNVKWINSTGIGAIIHCLSILRSRGGDIRFANLHGETLLYIQVMNLGKIIRTFNSIDEAVASFSKD